MSKFVEKFVNKVFLSKYINFLSRPEMIEQILVFGLMLYLVLNFIFWNYGVTG